MTRVALVIVGDGSRATTWSGTPRGLAGGLVEIGVDVCHVDADPPDAARRLVDRVADQQAARLRTATVVGRLVRLGRLDGVVQMGSQFGVPGRAPLVTYDDLTVKQALAFGEPYLTRLSQRDREAWLARQQRTYARARACCVGSSFAGRSLVEDFGVPAERVHVVGFGANPVPPAGHRDWSRPRLLVVARDWERKDVPAVVDAFAALRVEHPAATLDVVGDYPGPGGEGVDLHGVLRREVPGERARLDRLFAQATCFVMPSLREAFGIAYVEAGTAGIPSIGTTIGGAAEAIGPGGVVVPPGDGPALLAALRRLARPDEAASIGRCAADHARRYSWVAVAERIGAALRLPTRAPEFPLALSA